MEKIWNVSEEEKKKRAEKYNTIKAASLIAGNMPTADELPDVTKNAATKIADTAQSVAQAAKDMVVESPSFLKKLKDSSYKKYKELKNSGPE